MGTEGGLGRRDWAKAEGGRQSTHLRGSSFPLPPIVSWCPGSAQFDRIQPWAAPKTKRSPKRQDMYKYHPSHLEERIVNFHDYLSDLGIRVNVANTIPMCSCLLFYKSHIPSKQIHCFYHVKVRWDLCLNFDINNIYKTMIN